MKFPYSNSNLRLIDLLGSFRLSKKMAEARIEEYFRRLTDKKYILITNSCRTALYLAYQAIDKNGEAITSPLTCKVAVDPIIESGITPVYADIETQSLNMDPDDIAHRINQNTIAIQTIHLGGLSCDMDRICKLASDTNLIVIEDCAQALGARYKNKPTGSFGDVACFSLIKNAYGIGGGIFATNNKYLYMKAKTLNSSFRPTSNRLLWFRIIRNLIDTKRNTWIGEKLYNTLFRLRGKSRSYVTVKDQLHQPSKVELKIAAHQIARFSVLQLKRKEVGTAIVKRLHEEELLKNTSYLIHDSSYTKLLIYMPNIEASTILLKLHASGIEAMHLEHKHGGETQEHVIAADKALSAGLKNYLSVHDCIISLPLTETLKDKDFIQIIDSLKKASG